MTSEKRKRHTWEFVETLLGPAIYVLYFVFAYAATAVACALATGANPALPDGAASARNVTLALTLLALAGILAVALMAMRRISRITACALDDQDLFLSRLTLALALLSALAVFWTATASVIVPACL